MQNTSARKSEYSGDDDIAKAIGGPGVLEQFVHTQVRVVIRKRDFVSAIDAKVDDSEAQGNKLSVSRTNTLDISDKTSNSLSARAYQEYQEHKGESHLAQTSVRSMNMV